MGKRDCRSFAKKEDIAAKIPTFASQMGDNFPDLDFECDSEDLEGTFVNVDNRADPPDNGVILELEYGAAGDKDEIRITKLPVLR
jgi:hypothetical protein